MSVILIGGAVAIGAYYVYMSVTQSPASKATTAVSNLLNIPSEVSSLVKLAIDKIPEAVAVKSPEEPLPQFVVDALAAMTNFTFHTPTPPPPPPPPKMNTVCSSDRFECGMMIAANGQPLGPRMCSQPVICTQVPAE